MKVMLMTLPNEGQTVDYTTASFHLENKAVRYIPLGILSVARGISPHHQVQILDSASLGLSINQTLQEINTFKPDVLGISAVSRRAYAMAEILRRAKTLKVVGGPHVTHYASETLALGANAVFRGDGDHNFGAWLDGDHRDGIFDDYIRNINLVPFPQYELLRVEDYAIPEEEASNTLFKRSGARLSMFSSKGCPYRCVFCDVQQKKFRYLSASRVVDAMEFLLSRGANSVHIVDDSFNVRQGRVLGICEEIKRRGLRFEWSARGRAEIDSETAKAISEAGCRRLHVGIESLDENVLRWMNKKLDVETISKFCHYCREVGIQILGYFMIGSPVETREYRQRLPEMIKELGISYPYFNLLYPLAHTQYYESLLNNGTFKGDYWQRFAENPVASYELPLPRSEELQMELEETLRHYVEIFYAGEGR